MPLAQFSTFKGCSDEPTGGMAEAGADALARTPPLISGFVYQARPQGLV